jgi:hypothetical protein
MDKIVTASTVRMPANQSNRSVPAHSADGIGATPRDKEEGMTRETISLAKCISDFARRLANFTHQAPNLMASVAILTLMAMFAPGVNAACHVSPNPRLGLAWPESKFLQDQGNTASASAENAKEEGSIVGLWHVFYVSGGQPFDEGFDQWHSDGTEILNDTAPPQPANGAGTICLGVYKKIAPATYKLRHPFWSFDANGNLVGSGVILETVTVDAGGDNYHGTFTFDAFDLSGNLTFEATGDVSAKRITVD